VGRGFPLPPRKGPSLAGPRADFRGPAQTSDLTSKFLETKAPLFPDFPR